MKARKANPPAPVNEVEEEFVRLWRAMSSLWGISPTMAEIHGLLFITGKSMSMDDIMARLHPISRGNVSMNLSKLVEWGLVTRVHKRGDRRDYYHSLDDVWEIFTLVAAQRKRREIDPILTVLRRCREQVSPERPGGPPEDETSRERYRRVNDLYSLLSLMDGLAQRFFESQRGLRAAVDLLAQDQDDAAAE